MQNWHKQIKIKQLINSFHINKTVYFKFKLKM